MTDSITASLISARGIDLNQLEQVRTNVQAWQTDHGTQVRFVESRQLPMVDVVLRFNAGTSLDAEHSGLAALTLYMLDEGTEQRDASAFAEQIEQLGAVTDAQIRLEHASLSLRSLSSAAVLEPAMALFTEMVARPGFGAPQLAKVKQQLLAFQASRLQSRAHRARAEAFAQLYAGHPYGTPMGGNAAGIEAISREDLQAFHRRAYTANNLQVSIVGDLSRADAEALVEALAQALPQGWAAAELAPAPLNSPATVHIDADGASNTLLLAVPMSGQPLHADFPALMLAVDALGAGFDSRLMHELRQRRGLTYDIRSRVSPLKAGGVLSIDWDCAAQYTKATQTLVAQMLEALVEQGPSEAELALARQQRSGQLVRAVATNQELVELLSITCQQGLPPEHLINYQTQLSAVTVQSARAALQQQLDLTRKVAVSIGTRAPQASLPELPINEQ